MAGIRAGYGQTLGSTQPGTGPGQLLTAGLSNNQIPVWNAATSQLENSGLELDALTQSIRTALNLRSAVVIESGTAVFNLGSAHSIISTGENVATVNRVTGVTYHPTWQTAGIDGNWNSVQRTPTGTLVTNHPFQNDDTATVTNPSYDFTSLAFNHRLYRVTFSPNTSQTNVIAILMRQSSTDFIEYSRIPPFDIVGGANMTLNLSPFIDLEASQNFRLVVNSPDGDVVLNSDAAGNPFLLLDYWAWEDRPLATEQSLGDYRFDDTVNINADVTITSSNLQQYNRKIWLITGALRITITISDDIDLFFFGVHIVSLIGSVLIQNVGMPSTLMIDGMANRTYAGAFSAIFFRQAANVYQILSSSDPSGSNILAATFTGLTDTPASLGTAGQLVAVDTAGNALEFIDPLGTPGPPGPVTFVSLTDTPASLGTAGQLIAVDTAGNALEFVNTVAQNLGNFRFDNTVDVTGDITITSANLDTYNLKILLITGGSHTITVDAGAGLTFFGVYVRRLGDTGTLRPQAASNVRINNISGDTVLDARQSATYFQITTDRYQEIFNNFRPENFIDLSDTPAALGTAGQLVAVNSGASALVFIDSLPAGVGAFLALSDTPAAFIANQFLRVNGAGNAVEFVNAPAGTGVSAFLALNDTPAAFIAGQLLRVNTAGTAIEFGGTVGAASTDWDHRDIPAASDLPTTSRVWYRYTATGDISRNLPSTGITSGWHIFVANDSNHSTINLEGEFRPTVNTAGSNPTRPRITVSPGEGVIISWDGSHHRIGPTRRNILEQTAPEWRLNPLITSTSYGTWTSGPNGVNANNAATIADLMNNLIRIDSDTATAVNFVFDLPPVTDVSVGEGFWLFCAGTKTILIRPQQAGGQRIRRREENYNFIRPLRIGTGAGVYLVRSNTVQWNVIREDGLVL